MRGQVYLPDAILTFFVVVAIVALAPVIYTFIDGLSQYADGFSGLLLQLVVPFLIIALILSVGVSARRGG